MSSTVENNDVAELLSLPIEIRRRQYKDLLPSGKTLHLSYARADAVPSQPRHLAALLFFYDCSNEDTPTAKCLACLGSAHQPHDQGRDFPILWVNQQLRAEALDMLLLRNKVSYKTANPAIFTLLAALPKFTFSHLTIHLDDLSTASGAAFLASLRHFLTLQAGQQQRGHHFEHLLLKCAVHSVKYLVTPRSATVLLQVAEALALLSVGAFDFDRLASVTADGPRHGRYVDRSTFPRRLRALKADVVEIVAGGARPGVVTVWRSGLTAAFMTGGDRFVL